jgi:hypothetical protein
MKIHTHRARNLILGLYISLQICAPTSAGAHNEVVHQRMTDIAYHILLVGRLAAINAFPGDDLHRLQDSLSQAAGQNPNLRDLFRASELAVARLRSLPSGLPDASVPCVQPVAKIVGQQPNWELPPGRPLAAQPMGKLRFPITKDYGPGNTGCGIDYLYARELYGLKSPDISDFDTPAPSILSKVNPGSSNATKLPPRDFTGATLGYWAAMPDKAKDDWVIRSTFLQSLEDAFAEAVLGTGAAAVGTFKATIDCLVSCCSFPPCLKCLRTPATASGSSLIDSLTGFSPSAIEISDLTGLGHFVDVKPVSTPGAFDDVPGKLMTRAGPTGHPDMLEDGIIAFMDLAGVHLNYTKSNGPANYQVILGSSGAMGTDFHRNSVSRSPSQWELPLLSNLQMTPVDNLAYYGYNNFFKAHQDQVTRISDLGWPLHALGDASVPMHTVGTTGYGHRPYEDFIERDFVNLIGSQSEDASIATVIDILTRASNWRDFITNWRRLHSTNEVPIRDLVTALANKTRQSAIANPSAYKPRESLRYFFGGEDGAIQAYEDDPVAQALQKETLLEGIAAEVAFLIAVAEEMPS